jgi:type IV secretion system protein VirB9
MAIRYAMTLGVALIWTMPVAAQVRPQPGDGDPRIQSVTYDPNQVVLLESAPGYALTVGLAADEQIVSVAVGDSAAWQVSASQSGDHLFIKPLQGGVSTNMTVVTTTRLYAFDLVSLSAPSFSMAYTVQFRYPVSGDAQPIDDEGEQGAIRGRYKLHGDRAVRPIGISDDGEHTYIEWPAGIALPATYFRDDDGVETLANGAMRDGLYVIDSVHSRLIFRRDDDKARADRIEPEQAR